jgi:hypothetical protein
MAEFVFVDGPHELPAWTKQPATGGEAEQQPAAAGAAAQQRDPLGRGDCAQQPSGLVQQLPGGEPSAAAPLRCQQGGCKQAGPPRRAWLLTPEQHAALQQGPAHACGGGGVPEYADEWQLQAQTAGWEESQRELEQVLTEQGPFDGVLGFSQGAAVAAVLAAQQWLQQRQKLRGGGAASRDDAGHSPPRFAIFCSGYRSPLPAHQELLDEAAAVGGAALPTLHIYGGSAGEAAVRRPGNGAAARCATGTSFWRCWWC